MSTNSYLIIFILVFSFILISCVNNSNELQIDYYPNGNKKSIINNETDIINKKKYQYFYEDGSIKKKFYKINDRYDGTYESYFENHQLAKKINYIDGSKEGKSEAYFEDGQLYSYAHFVNDIRNGELGVYDQKGNLIYTNFLVNDFAHHVKKNNYDSLGNLISSQWDYIPKLELNLDTLTLDDTLIVDFYLPLPDSIFDLSNVFVKYNFIQLKQLKSPVSRKEINNLSYYEDSLSSGTIRRKFSIIDPEEVVLLGLVVSKREGIERLHRPFMDTIFVFPRSLNN